MRLTTRSWHRRDRVPPARASSGIVLFDYRMLGADGLEVLRFIRMQAMTAMVQVAMMSGDLKECLEGAQALLEKPFEMRRLMMAIRECLMDHVE